jgi:hypothetical protein
VEFETDSETEALAKERELIAQYKTYRHGGDDHWGANFTLGGEGVSGQHFDAETRRKMGLGRKGKKHTPEARAKMSAARLGRKLSSTHRANIRRASTGRLHSPETKAQLSELARQQWQRKGRDV